LADLRHNIKQLFYLIHYWFKFPFCSYFIIIREPAMQKFPFFHSYVLWPPISPRPLIFEWVSLFSLYRSCIVQGSRKSRITVIKTSRSLLLYRLFSDNKNAIFLLKAFCFYPVFSTWRRLHFPLKPLFLKIDGISLRASFYLPSEYWKIFLE